MTTLIVRETNDDNVLHKKYQTLPFHDFLGGWFQWLGPE